VTADFGSLPSGLPVPADDGACDHLLGLELPPVPLPAVDGSHQVLDQVPTEWLVLYVYPRTGGPGITLPDDWDLIPGARGCTPQGCAFRDHHVELAGLGATVWGVSAQPLEEQRDFSERMHIPFPLLNDSGLLLAGAPLRLPTFEGGGLTLYRRVTLLARDGRIEKVFYPVFPPDRNAAEVIGFLTSRS
jgi:peroxiredoxin